MVRSRAPAPPSVPPAIRRRPLARPTTSSTIMPSRKSRISAVWCRTSSASASVTTPSSNMAKPPMAAGEASPMPRGCATMVTRVATTIPRTTHCTRAPFPAGRTYNPADDASVGHRWACQGLPPAFVIRHGTGYPYGKECGFSVTTWLDTQGMGFMPPTGPLCPPGEGRNSQSRGCLGRLRSKASSLKSAC